MELYRHTALQAAHAISTGESTSEEYVSACLDRICAREKDVNAWASIDPAFAIQQARTRDKESRRGLLQGIAVGIKDVIDSADLSTEYGSPIYRGHRPRWDASCVALVKKAGGIVMGKTATAEFAYRHPCSTRNPHDLEHSPGGSSSGSAAAVADFMVPLAVATQTGGSIIRPASYCGIVGFKPSFNLVNRSGLKFVSESLDHIGVMARTVADVALFMHAVCDTAMPMFAQRSLAAPRIGLYVAPCTNDDEVFTRKRLEHAVVALVEKGARVSECSLPEALDVIAGDHATIMEFEAARALEFEYQNHREELSAPMRQCIENGWRCSRERYEAAMTNAIRYRAQFSEILDGVDVIVTQAAPGEAPEGLVHTGSSVYNRVWTLLHGPCITVPMCTGAHGLPIGIQILGRHGSDLRTLSWADWIQNALAQNHP